MTPRDVLSSTGCGLRLRFRAYWTSFENLVDREVIVMSYAKLGALVGCLAIVALGSIAGCPSAPPDGDGGGDGDDGGDGVGSLSRWGIFHSLEG